MLTRTIFAAATLLAFYALPVTAEAQDDLFRRPSVSPYLNLMQGPDQFGNVNPNYQTLVRPLVDDRRAIQSNRAAINRLGRSYGGGGAYSGGNSNTLGQRFMNYSHYYSGIRN